MSGTIDQTSIQITIAAGIIVSGPATGVSVIENGGAGVFDRTALLANVTDIDAGATLEIQVDDLNLPPGVVYNHVAGYTTQSIISYYGFAQIIVVPTADTLTFDPTNAAYQSLAAGEEMDIVVAYTVTDGANTAPAQAIFHIVGTDDAPVVSGTVTGSALNGDAPVSLSGLANATDVDHGAVLSVVAAPPAGAEAENFINAAGVAEGAAPPPPPILPFDPTILPAGVTFDAAASSFRFDPSDPAYQGLSRGQTQVVTVNYGVSDGTLVTAASMSFTVTGVNHAPVVSGPVTGLLANEGSGAASYNLQSLLSTTIDRDVNDTLTVTFDPAQLPHDVSFASTPAQFVAGYTIPGFTIAAHPFTGGGWNGYIVPAVVVPDVVVPDTIIPATTELSLDTSDAEFESLAQGETRDVVIHYQVSDGLVSTDAQAVFRVVGVNDAPVVSGSATAAATEDAGIVTISAFAHTTDVDHGAVLSVVATPQAVALPTPGSVVGDDAEIEAQLQAATTAAGAAVANQAFDPSTLPPGVTFDAVTNSFSLDPSNAAYQYLAQGQTATVTVNYGVSDGFVATAASAVFTVTGTNDAPVVTGSAKTSVTEDGTLGLFNHAALVAHASDVDLTDKLDVQIDESSLPPGVVYNHVPGYITTVGVSTTYYGAITSFVDIQVAPVDTLSLDPSNAAYQSLAAGEVEDVIVNYAITDGTVSVPTQAIFHVTGVNDAPVVSAPVTAAATEDGAAVTVSGLANATDIDHGTVLTVVAPPPPVSAAEANFSAAGINETAALPPPPILPFDPSTLPAGVSFDAATNSFTIDPANAAFQSLGLAQTEMVTVDYGVSDGFVNTSASVRFIVTGTNDAPVVSGPLAVSVTAAAAGNAPTTAITTLQSPDGHGGVHDALSTSAEASAEAGGLTAAQISNAVDLLANATDIDQGDQLSVVGLPAVLPAGLSHIVTPGYYTASPVYYGAPVYHPGFDLLTVDPSSAAFRALAAGETETLTVSYGITDGHVTVPTTASFTITGVNDAPVVPSPVASANEDGAGVTLKLLSTASDPDHGSVLSLASVQSILPAGITYDAVSQSLTLDPTNAAFQSLAQGQIASYAVGFSVTDGQLVTPSTAIFNVTGVNDAPVIVAPMVGTANEDGARAAIEPLLNVTDIDTPLESLRVVGLPATLPAGVSFDAATQKFFLDPTNAAYQSLSLNETMTVSIPFGISDGFAIVPATAVFTVSGRNDTPVVTGTVNAGSVNAQAAPVSVNLLANATDIDHLDVLKVAGVTATVTSGTWSSPVAFTVANNRLTIDPHQFGTLPKGNTVGITFNYQVSDGNPNGTVTDSATIAIQGTYLPPPPPTGVTIAPVPGQVAKAQGGSAITAKVAIATFTQVGAAAADTFNYTLGGTGSGTAFTLGTSAGIATLSSGSSGAVGAAGGQLYALNVTATDSTTGLSAPAAPVDVVVGLGKGANTINLASIPGLLPAAPTFVCDLGGADTINGAGMTGKLWISSGQGADVMTGGSGVNDYLYGSANDSTATAMDIITNFHAATDMLDFTGLGGKPLTVGALASTATSVAGNAIGWQTSGGNTFVYVNTGGNSAALASAAMKIELAGVVPLSSSNIAHL